MKSFRSTISLVASLFFAAGSLFAQAPLNGGGIWSDVDEQAMTSSRAPALQSSALRTVSPLAYRTLALNRPALEQLLANTVPEFSLPMQTGGVELQVPMPSGEFARFLIQESPIMEPGLAARYPQFKTYVGQGIEDPSATMRLDLTPQGFHAMILSPKGDVFIDPYWRDSSVNYVSYFKRDFVAANKPFSCLVGDQEQSLSSTNTVSRPTGATLRSYRLALACTGEYAGYVCRPNAANLAGTLAAIITSINRCSAVYEREFAIRFLLVADEDKLVFLDPATDPFTNNSPFALLGQNQSTCDSVIGTANYDFGHVFSTAGGGLSSLGVVCRNGSKASSETGTSAPVGDPYDIDYVVHEMGHQFGANHPFNGTSGACAGGNRNAATAYEVGSGTTIMAYAGICAPQDLAPHSDDYFYTINYDEVDSYTGTGTGTGSTCPVMTSTGNTPPTIAALTAFTIPGQTPFSLTASATDPDGDTLTYCWEEFDKGAAQDPTKVPRDNGSSPIFRSFAPTTNPTRLFPSLTYILNNQNIPPATLAPDLISGEFLPTTSRTMTYRVTVRDNRAGGGGSNYASTTVTSVSTAGPFAVTSLNTATTIPAGSNQTVTWNVANTNVAPINCANVKISLSTDGGNTFPTILAASVPNNGSRQVTIPNDGSVATTQGRIKVEAIGNIFFDITDANLTITSTNNSPPTLTILPGGITVMRGTITPTVADVATANDPDGNGLSASVSNLPFGAHLTPTVTGGTISISAVVDCPLVTTLTTRTYPITLTVTDSAGSSTSGIFNLIVAPNPSPTIGTYPEVRIRAHNARARSKPATAANDPNNNLAPQPYSVIPTELPGGGTITINQHNGAVTVRTTDTTTPGTTTAVRVTVLDTCGAAAVQFFNVMVSNR